MSEAVIGLNSDFNAFGHVRRSYLLIDHHNRVVINQTLWYMNTERRYRAYIKPSTKPEHVMHNVEATLNVWPKIIKHHHFFEHVHILELRKYFKW